MPPNEAVSSILNNDLAAQPRAFARSTIWDREEGRNEWWRYAAQPFVLVLGFLILAVISAISVFLVVLAQSDARLVRHTLEVENQLSGLRALVQNAESGQRGYLLTGDPIYLDDYRNGVDAILPATAELKVLTADNPVQQQSLVTLEPIVLERLDKLRDVVRHHDAGDSAATIALLRAGQGRALMQDISRIIDRMIDEERRLLELRTSKAARTNVFLLVVNLAGIALMMGLGALSILTVRRMAEEAWRDSEKRADELQAAVRELDAFSYSVSHDLRTPLRAIDGFSRILLKQHASALGSEARDYLQSVCDNAVQMGRLVNDLLAFSRLSRKPLSKQHITTRAIVEQVLREVRQQAEGRCVDVSIGHLPQIWGDPALLKQVFMNLIDNAFKYTRMRANAVIEIGSREIVNEQVFFVRDNGAGFDMQYADKLFGVFQRLHRAEDFEGTGVGLAIVQRIVQRHGGRVWAEAAVGRGATFYFTTEVPNHG
jgi:signal transduction histidine kinase